MKTAIAELIFICIICAIASIIPQGMEIAYYERLYSPSIVKIIYALGFNQTFTSPIFVIAIALLCLNLLLCNVVRLPVIVRQFKNGFLQSINTESVAEISSDKVDSLLEKLHMKKTVLADGRVYGVRGKFGLFGAWICHVGFLVIAIGFVVGNYMSKEFTVYGLPGTEEEVGDSGIFLTIDDFNVFLRDDFTVEQFESKLTARKDGAEISGTTQVNHPFSAFGYRFYQNSEGWTNDVTITKGGEFVSKQTVYMGEHFDFPDMPVVVVLNQFYPDFNEMTMKNNTPLIVNPHTRFSIYINGHLADMNFIEMGNPITVEDVVAVLDNPRKYSLLQARHDPSPPIVLIGSVLILLSLMLTFYFQLEECIAVEKNGKAKIYVYAKRNALLLKEKVEAICHE